MTNFSFEAIGTNWDINIKEDLSETREASLYKKILDRAEVFDKDYSRFRSDSLVTKISRESGKYKMPDDFGVMIELYKKVYGVSSGLVTPLVGDTLVSAGYDAAYSLKKGEMKRAEKWQEVLEWEKPFLYVKKPIVLDFGACGKGYLVDIISELIESEGIKEYLVDGSGDMRHRGEDTIKIGLEHPGDATSVVGTVILKSKSLCGSAGNRRKWADMHHIVNPITLSSPSDISTVWVAAETTMLADILTTCLFFLSPTELKKHFDFEYVILKSDYTVEASNSPEIEIFI
ncbi:MAG: FAD:protein FMN transferase [Minisyncoccia bacterium]